MFQLIQTVTLLYLHNHFTVIFLGHLPASKSLLDTGMITEFLHNKKFNIFIENIGYSKHFILRNWVASEGNSNSLTFF